MNEDISKIRLLIDKINALGFFDRLFGWKKFKRELPDIAAGLTNVNNELEKLQFKKEELSGQLLESSTELKNALKEKSRLEGVEMRLSQNVSTKDAETTRLTGDYNSEKAQRESLERQLRDLNRDLGDLKRRAEQAESGLTEVREENVRLKNEEDLRMEEHKKNIASLNDFKEQIQKERQQEFLQKQEEAIGKIEALKQTWRNHQNEVQNYLRALCSKHTIQYVDKVPFKGEPDNTLFICDEHVVFDAKSPSGDDLSNFPLYLKGQAEQAKKYAKIEGVKTDIFFVVPSNSLPAIKQFVYNMADYNVFVISVEVLEPLVLALCKIEEYEFAEQLSPEDRENICRILGKFAHLSKRRIQIDSFFAKQFIELAYKCENSLPADIHDKVLEFERSEKLNPPVEKRAKSINTKELETDSLKIDKEADTKGIVISDEVSIALDNVSLYK